MHRTYFKLVYYIKDGTFKILLVVVSWLSSGHLIQSRKNPDEIFFYKFIIINTVFP